MHPLLVGGTPFTTTSIYGLILYLEKKWGIHYSIGGTGHIISGLEKLMKEVKWVVITRDNAEQIFAELESKGEPIAMFGMTTDGYENLTLNMQDIKAYLLEQKQILLQYREYYEGEDKDDAKE